MAFNALKYVDELVDAGIPEKHAKAQVSILQDFRDSELATKGDLKLAVKELEYKIVLSRYITILAIPAILVALKKLGIM